jgi:glycosyltransferase involved in cell wall biosynthesis
VFCLSSRREALPLVLLEAMAEGLPCVATDVGDVRTAVGEAALVVPPDNATALAAALRELLTDLTRRQDLGCRARRLAQQAFDADLMAQRTFAVLDHVRRCSPSLSADTTFLQVRSPAEAPGAARGRPA